MGDSHDAKFNHPTPLEETLAPERPLRPEQVHRTIVIVADDLGFSSHEIPNVRNAMTSVVEQQMALQAS